MRSDEIKNAIENAGVVFMTACSILGDRMYWADILMHNCEIYLKAFLHREVLGEFVKQESDFEKPEIIEAYDQYINNLRALVQRQFDALADSLEITDTGNRSTKNKERVNKLKLMEAGKDFIKNNKVDYGNKTVKQIAAELNISIAEVRRRKQNGEL